MKMINQRIIVQLMGTFCFLFLSGGYVYSQGFGKPLEFQGVDHLTLHSSASRGAGGITIGLKNDLGLMFSNPTVLQNIEGIKLSIGSIIRSSKSEQIQQYSPLAYYPNFSLLMEGLTGYISKQDSIYITNTGDTVKLSFSEGDTIQRPFDKIGPNWNLSNDRKIPFQAFIAAPLNVGEIKIAIGVGMVEYANLNWYFQNNNVLSPSILSVSPSILGLAELRTTPVQWFQNYQVREGSINGYGGAISISLSEKISLGISGLLLNGKTDDFESRTERGTLRFVTNNYFRLDSSLYHYTKKGTSDYSGQEFTVSGAYQGKFVGINISIKSPTEIVRKYKSAVYSDTTLRSFSTQKLDSTVIFTGNINGEDKISIPMRAAVGLSFRLRENVMIGIEYEIRSYESTEYSKTNGSTTHPWAASNVFHLSAQYTPVSWLMIRSGIRQQSEVYEPIGNPFGGEPVNYSIYSIGAGFTFESVVLNIAYEYAHLKYVDSWGAAISKNSEILHTFSADISYELPW